jgi:hypothetical protein
MTTTVTPHSPVIPAVPKVGRRPLRADERDRILALRSEGFTITDVAAMTGRSTDTVSRIAPGREQMAARQRVLRNRNPAEKTCRRCRLVRPVDLFAAKTRICIYCIDPNPLVPVYPLLPALAKIQARHEWENTTLANVIGVDERTLSFWRHLARDPRLAAVEDILDRLDFLWFDVYNESTVRHVVRIVETRRSRVRRVGGEVRHYYEVVSRTRVGDLGPNLTELARLERAFSGPDLAADFNDFNDEYDVAA